MKNTTKEEVYDRIKAGWMTFGRYKEIFYDRKLPISLKIKVFDQYLLPTMAYGGHTRSFKSQIVHKLETTQTAMKSRTIGITLKDKITNI